MTFTAVGSGLQFDTTTFTLSPNTVGDFIMLSINNNDNTTTTVTSVVSSNATWTEIATKVSSVISQNQSMWFGSVTSTASQTVTVSWSSTTPADVRVAGQEFKSTTKPVVLQATGYVDVSGTNTWATLTPGIAELYYGYCQDGGTAVAGSTTGYTYLVTIHGNGMAYNVSYSGNPPVWGDSGFNLGIMVLMREARPVPYVTQGSGTF